MYNGVDAQWRKGNELFQEMHLSMCKKYKIIKESLEKENY